MKALLQNDMKKWSLLLWVATFSAMFGVYFLMSWIPKIVIDAGVSLEKAIWVGMSMNFGGLIGILWLGYRSATSGLRSIIRELYTYCPKTQTFHRLTSFLFCVNCSADGTFSGLLGAVSGLKLAICLTALLRSFSCIWTPPHLQAS